MIGKLKGVIDGLDENTAIVDVRGVGYEVLCSSRTLAALHVGEAVEMHIETHVRDDAISLFAFPSAQERRWFQLLTTVQGVGGKAALAILGVATPEQLTVSVSSGDRNPITRAAGVGPKLAARVINELRDKVGPVMLAAVGHDSGGVGGSTPSGASDAVSALVNLGFSRGDAFSVVLAVAADLGEAASVDALIRESLARLAPREVGT
ncbi:MAG: Holliday junction branch migration protein RuvA [Hyphomicrobiales bacterium]|nr:Holliday junction branch migration protein RuvA [Hyphomicrobiales bacterium]